MVCCRTYIYLLKINLYLRLTELVLEISTGPGQNLNLYIGLPICAENDDMQSFTAYARWIYMRQNFSQKCLNLVSSTSIVTSSVWDMFENAATRVKTKSRKAVVVPLHKSTCSTPHRQIISDKWHVWYLRT